MELTDEQYNQVMRYVDDEMDAGERQTFETAINENRELYDEVNLYKEMRFLSESVDKKITNTCQLITTVEKAKNEEAWELLAGARQDWETKQDAVAKQSHTVTMQQPATIPSSKTAKVSKVNEFKWLAAAVFTGLVFVSIVWWNTRNTKDIPDAVVNKKGPDSTVVVNNKADTQTRLLHNDTLPPARSGPGRTQPVPPSDYASANKIEQERKYKAIFKSNFQPDSIPQNIESIIEEPVNLYAEKNYKEAIENFQMLKDMSELSRGRGGGPQTYDEVSLFHIHYYMGLSYMASGGSTTKAIAELRSAIAISPDRLLQSKAQWYQSLAYIEKGEVQKAEAVLKRIILHKQNSKYRQKAVKLLEEISK